VDKILPFRGTIVQLAFLASLLYFAHIAPEMHNPIMVTLAGLGTLLTQRARMQAGSGNSGSGTGNGDSDSLYPLGLRDSRKPPSDKKTAFPETPRAGILALDRKSTRLNSSH